MPALPPVPNVLKVVARFAAETLAPVIVNHFLYSAGPPTNADCYSIATIWLQALTTEFAGFYPTDFSFSGADVTDLSTPMGGVGSLTNPHPGTNTSPALPGQVCALIHKTIQRRYRGGHPRTYLPAFATDQKLNDKQWTTGATVGMGTAWAAAVGTLIGNGPYGSTSIVGECNVSYRSGHAIRPTPLVDPILVASGEQNMATQRKRLGR